MEERRSPMRAPGWSCYTTGPAESLALFEAARARCPVAHSSEHDGFHMLLDYKDVRKAMADHRTFSSEPQVLRPMLPRKPIPALDMDPPRHGAWRAIFNAAVTPATPAAMEPFVRADVRRHIARFAPSGGCDIVAELCEPVPAETICHLVGVEEDRVPAIREAAIAMFAAQGDPEEFGRRQEAFAAVTVSEIHARRDRPRDDFLTRLAGMSVEGRMLDDGDLVGLMAAFLGAGHHSTTSALASMIHEVFSVADRRDRLIAEPALIPVAVEEALRLHPPFFGFFRRTKAEVEVAGVTIPEGQDVYMGWAAANRDPAMFEEPACFRLDRESNRHMSFGFGIHNCPGSNLARMEMRVVLEELLSTFPGLAVEGEVPAYRFGGGDYSFLPELRVAWPA
ncbi:cytochrome P450 [Nostoc sp. 3335mG]|nr:cytochrome P450 [Nostoc sp. 3335mG]